MKNWMKTLLCTVAAATLVACGGSDDAPATVTATGGGSATTAASLTGMSDQVSAAASFTIDGLLDGYFGPLPGIVSAPTSFETPAADSALPTPTCSSGSVTSTYNSITYTNCKLPDATLNGKIGVAIGEGGQPHTITFNVDTGNPLTAQVTTDSKKTVTFKYAGTQVISRLEGEPVTGFTAKVNTTVTVDGGSTVFKLADFVVDFSTVTESSVSYEVITLNGKYTASIKLSDFGVPATPGLPETVEIDFTVTTPTAIKSKKSDGSVVQGIYKLASPSFSIEVDFGAKKVRLSLPGAPAQEFDLAV